ncbi:MAG TPA: sugar transporter [Rhodospirillaceae bacterium]|nr:sugar transporter [Rhodospirillaceae bacterium]
MELNMFCNVSNDLRRLFTCAIVAISLSGSLSGCASTSVDLPPAPEGVMPIADLARNLPPYRIQIGDQLDLRFILNPELNESVVVRPDGMISTSVVQDVMAYGVTPAELKSSLIASYKSQLTKPELRVVVKNFAPTKVYVLGEVNNPGEMVSVGPTLSLTQALAKAGGMKDSAETRQIIILRRGAGEQPVLYGANFDSISSGKRAMADIRLAPYDVVFVSRSAIAEANKVYNQYFKNFIAPSIGASYSIGNKN